MPSSRKRKEAFRWKRNRSRHGVEYYRYPSDLARQLWYYVFAIGQARTPHGEEVDHPRLDRYLLHFVLRGEMHHRIRNQIHVARTGEACLMDLSVETLHGTGGRRKADSYWLLFNGKDMPRYFSELRADRLPVFSGMAPGIIKRLFERLLSLTRSEDPSYEARSSVLVASLLAELYSTRARGTPQATLGSSARIFSEPVRKGIDWMIRLYDQPHSIKQMCNAVGYSRSHYSRLFHKETGQPPIQWLNRYRIEQSKRLLLNSDKPAAEIARAVGIADQNYFSRLFHQQVKVSPRTYRATQGAASDTLPRPSSVSRA